MSMYSVTVPLIRHLRSQVGVIPVVGCKPEPQMASRPGLEVLRDHALDDIVGCKWAASGLQA